MTPRRIQALIIAVGAFFPLLTYAQATGLVPCGTASFANYLDATSCNFCYLALLIQNVVNFLIMVSIPISVALFAWAGVMFFTSAGNPKNIGRAKKIFTSVFWGFLLTLSAWLIVQLALQTITRSDYSPSSFFQLSRCNQYNDYRLRNLSINNVLSGITVVPFTGPKSDTGTNLPSEGTYSDGQARIQLQTTSGGMISINKADCSPGQQDCTSLNGMQINTVTQTINLQQACGCSLLVTGGTEAGHSTVGDTTHSSGYKIDIGLGAVDSYIQNNLTKIGNRASDGAQQWIDSGDNIYAREGDHWDITVKAVTPLPTQPRTN